jgi:hypothetical protein
LKGENLIYIFNPYEYSDTFTPFPDNILPIECIKKPADCSRGSIQINLGSISNYGPEILKLCFREWEKKL